MIWRVLLLIGGALAFWLLAGLPFRILTDDPAVGEAALVYSGVSLAVCLLPTTLTLAWGCWAMKRSPHDRLMMALGGTGVRMFTVLAAGLGLYLGVPYFRAHGGFWTWLLVSYLFTLALETALLVTGRPASQT